MGQATLAQGPIGGNRRADGPADLFVQSDGQTDGLVVIVGIDRDELADLAEIPLGAVVEVGQDLGAGGDLQAHRLGEDNGERLPDHRFCRPQTGRDVQFPSLFGGAGVIIAEPDPGRSKVCIRVDVP